MYHPRNRARASKQNRVARRSLFKIVFHRTPANRKRETEKNRLWKRIALPAVTPHFFPAAGDSLKVRPETGEKGCALGPRPSVRPFVRARTFARSRPRHRVSSSFSCSSGVPSPVHPLSGRVPRLIRRPAPSSCTPRGSLKSSSGTACHPPG